MSSNSNILDHILELRRILKNIFLNNPQTRDIKNYSDEESYEKNIFRIIEGQNLEIFRRISKKMIVEFIYLERDEFLKLENDLNFDDQTNFNYDLETNQEPPFTASFEQSHLNWVNDPRSIQKQENSRSRKLSQKVSRPVVIVRPENVSIKESNLNPELDNTKKRSVSLKSPRRDCYMKGYQKQDQSGSIKKLKKNQSIKIQQVQKDNDDLFQQNQLSKFDEEIPSNEINKNIHINDSPKQKGTDQNENIVINQTQNTQIRNEVDEIKDSSSMPFTVHEEESKQEQSQLSLNHQAQQRQVQITSVVITEPVQVPDRLSIEQTRNNEPHLQIMVVQTDNVQVQNIPEVVMNPSEVLEIPSANKAQLNIPQNLDQNQNIFNQNYIYLENEQNQYIRTILRDINDQLRQFKYEFERNEAEKPKNQQKIAGFFFKKQTETNNPKQSIQKEKFNVGNLLFKLIIDSNKRLVAKSCQFIIKRNGLDFQTTKKLPKKTTDLQKLTGLKPALRKQRYGQLYRQLNPL